MKKNTVIFYFLVILAVTFALSEITEAQRRGWYGRGRAPMASDLPPVPKDDQEKKIIEVLEEMAATQGGMLNVAMDDGRLLRLLTETMGAKNVVEIGTSNGYSSLWILLALRTTGGKLTTFEIDSYKVRLATENFKKAGVTRLVSIIEGDAHKEVTKLKGPVDLLFIDADKEGYLDYLNKLLPLIRPGGLIVSHNINSVDQDFFDAITTNPALETIIQNQQLGGVSVTMKKR